MHCHDKFISGNLKSKDLNDTNEPRCSSKVVRICRKMPRKSEMTTGITLIKKKKEEKARAVRTVAECVYMKLGFLYIIYATLK